MAANLGTVIFKVAMEELVKKVKSAIKEKKEQWEIVQRDAVFITDELETMQSFLNSANAVLVRTDVTRTWVRQVRNLSYDFEDCIEFILHLDTDKRGSWWLRMRPSCNCCGKKEVALPVDDAVTQIKQLRARVEDVSKRSKRYRFVTEGSTSNSLAQQKLVSGSAVGTPGFNIIVDDARDKAARSRNVVDLTKLVNGESHDRQVISVWATGDDLGTLSIIRNMYDDLVTKGNFKCRAWVKVMHPINPPEFIRSLLVQFYANYFQEQGVHVGMNVLSRLYLKLKRETDALSWTGTSAGDLVKEFVRQINRHRYLIILEDLSSMVQWEAVSPYLRDRKNGSRIVVLTRHHEIASLCTGNLYKVLELQGFSADQYACVFFNAGSEHAIGGAREGYHLVGRESEVTKLLNLITDRPDPDRPPVVSVWGFPGSGKTAVVAEVFNFKHCCSYNVREYFDSWTLINMYEQSKLMGFCKWLLSCPDPASLPLKGKDPVEQCRYLLETYRCLVVVDEVQSSEDWDLIFANLISAASTSCIIVVAAEESVARHCAGADNLVCGIKSLQATAAFDLLKQVFELNSKRQAIQNNGESHEEQASQNNGVSHEDPASENNRDSHEEQASQNIGVSHEDHASQNNGDSHEQQASQNNGFLHEAQASQNNGDSQEHQASQNNGVSHEDQASQNNGDSHEEQASQNNGVSHEDQASQNNGDSHAEEASQNSGLSHQDQASQNNGYSHEEQASQNNGVPHEDQASQNNGDSHAEEASQNNGVSHEDQASQNNGVEHAPQNNGDPLSEHVSQNNGSSLEEETYWNSNPLRQIFWYFFNVDGRGLFQNIRHSVDKQPIQNIDNSCEDEVFQDDGNLLGEPEVQNYVKSVEERFIQKNKENLSLGNPNVKAILSRSGGLPQVIVALGRYLANHHIQTSLIDNFMQELHISQEFYSLRGLLAWMRSYFWSGPPSLMRCMLYLLNFPPGAQTFRRRRLVRRWIAEGFAKGIESNNSDGFAGELFDKLASQGVIQQVSPTATEATSTRYNVHGFFHEYMISRPMEEKLFFPLEVSVLEEGQYGLGTERIGQHLAIGRRWGRDEFVFHNLDLSRLRSLTVSGEWRSFFISGKMSVLRVLDLEDTSNVKVEDLDEIGEVLPRLKYLSLRGCKNITRLPNTIGGLRQLQTLDIRHTSVDTLPTSVTKLQNLQYVRAGTTVPLDDDANTVESSTPTPAAADPSTPSTSRPSAAALMSRFALPWWMTCRRSQLAGSGNGGAKVLGGIGKMIGLHTLDVIDVSAATGQAVLEELKNLTQLRKLGVSGVNQENCTDVCSAISSHAHLESLSVWFGMGLGMNQAGCLDAITAPVKLQSLMLYRHVDRNLPSWIRPELVLNLSKLHLYMTTIPQVEIEVLGDLPKLRTLCLYFEEFQGHGLRFQRGFNLLQVLKIVCNQTLQAVTFHSGVMYNLEFLKLCCRGAAPSSLRFTGLKELKSLNKVLLSGSYNDELEQHLQSQLDEHPRKFKPVLKVC